MSKKLNTKSIYEKNQTRVVPDGFGETVIWLHNIRSLHNVGSIFRSSDSFGVKQLILSGYTSRPPRAEISKTALGADEFVDWITFDDVKTVLEFLGDHNYRLIGLEQTTDSIDIFDLKHEIKPVCLVLGNEISGIDDEIIPHLDAIVEIPQYGRKHSLNVSVAAGVALFHLHEMFRKNSN